MEISNKWGDYECLAGGDGEKVERFGKTILRRPDAQIVWPKDKKNDIWKRWDGFYHRSDKGGGYWEFRDNVQVDEVISYGKIKFKIAPTNFKHLGIFPEQACNWDFVMKVIGEHNSKEEDKEFRVLNLFAYTGCASVCASYAGASEVVHVDASKGMVEWAKENVKLNGLEDRKVRFIVDDVIKFLEREKRRGRTYHGIIMDPPSYGRGPNGELWKLEASLGNLVEKAKEVLDPEFGFLLISCYTTGILPTSLNNLLKRNFPSCKVETGEIGLPISEDDMVLPCGIYGRVTRD